MKPLSWEALRRALYSTRFYPTPFDYIELRDAQLVRTIAAGSGYVHVIGHRDHGSYEWVYQADPQHPAATDIMEISFTNMGYSSSSVCLRDALIVACDDHPDDPAHKSVVGNVLVPMDLEIQMTRRRIAPPVARCG